MKIRNVLIMRRIYSHCKQRFFAVFFHLYDVLEDDLDAVLMVLWINYESFDKVENIYQGCELSPNLAQFPPIFSEFLPNL